MIKQFLFAFLILSCVAHAKTVEVTAKGKFLHFIEKDEEGNQLGSFLIRKSAILSIDCHNSFNGMEGIKRVRRYKVILVTSEIESNFSYKTSVSRTYDLKTFNDLSKAQEFAVLIAKLASEEP